MFAVAAPQTVTIAGADDTPPMAVTFRTDGDDVSRCAVDVLLPNGDVHTTVFNTRGHMVGQSAVIAADVKAAAEARAAPEDQPKPSDKEFFGAPHDADGKPVEPKPPKKGAPVEPKPAF